MKQFIREHIYETIRDEITFGQLNPGERLTESDLAAKFKASRSPIREALRQLESEGLITAERNKGITVSKLSLQEVEEIYNLRWLLESYAARLTAEKAKQEDVQFLQDLQEVLKEAARNFDLEGWLTSNALFHDFLEERCGNSNLIPVLQILKRRVYRYRYVIISIPGQFEKYLDQHEGIIRGCIKNDGDMAEHFMRQHLATIKEVTTNYLKKSTEVPRNKR